MKRPRLLFVPVGKIIGCTFFVFCRNHSHQSYFLIITVLEVGLGIIWLMMNNQRVGAELLASQTALKSTVKDLEKALSEVKTLSCILPICMHCKEIRDDKGYWQQLEAFIGQHSEAEFSHGICPTCMKEQYSDAYARHYDTYEKKSNYLPFEFSARGVPAGGYVSS